MPYKDKEKQKEAQQRYEEKRRGTRHRGWVGVLYPESAPEDWRERLTNEGVPTCVSPLHDRDVNADGTPKKPHYHVLMVWDGPMPYETAKMVMDAIGAVMPPKNPKPGTAKPWAVSVRGAARYLCHTDNPEKAQYSTADVQCFSGADYLELVSCAGDDDMLFDEITDFIDENAIVSYAALVRYCKQERPDWKRYVYHRGAAGISRYIKSYVWENQIDRASTVQEVKRQAELEAGNWAMNVIADAVEKMRDSAGAEDQPKCDWCGKPATGGSAGPEGSIYWCDEHEREGRELSERLDDNDW